MSEESEGTEDNARSRSPEAELDAKPLSTTATLPPPYGTRPPLRAEPSVRKIRQEPTLVGIAPSPPVPAAPEPPNASADRPRETRARAPLGPPSTPPPPPSEELSSGNDLVTSFDYDSVAPAKPEQKAPTSVELPVDYAMDVPLPGTPGLHSFVMAPTDPAPPVPALRPDPAMAATLRPPEARRARSAAADTSPREPSTRLRTEPGEDLAPELDEKRSRRLGPLLVAVVGALLVISGWLLFGRATGPASDETDPVPGASEPNSAPASAQGALPTTALNGTETAAEEPSTAFGSDGVVTLPPIPRRISALPARAREERAMKLRKAARRTFRFKQYEASEKLWRNALQYAPDDATTRAGLALALDRQGKRAEALAWMRMALELDASSVDYHIYLGAMLEDSGDRSGAIAAFEEAYRLDPNDKRARHRLRRLESAERP